MASTVLRRFPSSSSPSTVHEVRQKDTGEVFCSCRGCASHKHCKHMDTWRRDRDRANLAAAVQSVGVGGSAAVQAPRSSIGQFVSGARAREHQCPLCSQWFPESEMRGGRFPEHGCRITVTMPPRPASRGIRPTTVTTSSKPKVAPPVQDKPDEMTASEGMKARLSGLEIDE